VRVSVGLMNFFTDLLVSAFVQKLCLCYLRSMFPRFCELEVDGSGTCEVRCHLQWVIAFNQESKVVDLPAQMPSHSSQSDIM